MTTLASPARRALAAHMAEQAIRLLDALTDDQRSVAQWSFPSNDERRQWFYTPTNHGGLPLGEMSSPQQRLAYRLMASGLSTAGYVIASTIMGLENVLDQLEGFTASWNRPRGRDPLLYYVRIFGEPSSEGSWSWRIGGHHISLSFTIVDGAVAGTTPLFLGADPASSPLLGPHPLRPLEGVEDLARELTHSLDRTQQQWAIVTTKAPSDLVGVNRTVLRDGDEPLPLREIWRGRLPKPFDALAVRIQDAADEVAALTVEDLTAMAYTTTPKGLPASAMTGPQREMLDTLLRRYTDRLPDELAAEESAKFAGAALDDVHLLWAGSLEPGVPHYYRLHSPVLLAEYDNTARDANHVHTVWRDPRGDFGDDALARHRSTHDH
jgi:Protein of unknown function (DUF3500)